MFLRFAYRIFCGEQLMDINESPVYVLLNPSINPAQKDLPVTIFESGKMVHIMSYSYETWNCRMALPNASFSFYFFAF